MNPLAYSVGGLLYTPADSDTFATHVIRGDWPDLTAVCLCLEDSIQDAALSRAEARLVRTLDALGLRKLNHVVVKEDTPAVRGMINAVSHLVCVTPVEE